MQLRELLEERTQLQGDLNDLEAQVQELQTRANSATYLESEVGLLPEQLEATSTTYQVGASEKMRRAGCFFGTSS